MNNLKEIKIDRKTHVMDAGSASLGRLATRIAVLLMGKHKPSFVKHVDMGDIVLIKNIDKLRVTGNKSVQKMYYSYSGYPGGLRAETYNKVFAKDPFIILKKAVYNMLPKNRLRDKRIKRLKIMK